MARPSSHLDQKLLQTGLELLAQKRTTHLSINEICKTANVNTGMFVYLFKNKENFLKQLFEMIHEQMTVAIRKTIRIDMNEMECLKTTYRQALTFIFENKNVSRMVFTETFTDKNLYKNYIKKGIFHPYTELTDAIKVAYDAKFLRQDLTPFEIQHRLFFETIMPILYSDCAGLLAGVQDIPDWRLSHYLQKLDEIFSQLEVL